MAPPPAPRPTTVLGVLSALTSLGVAGCGDDDPCDGQRSFDLPPAPDPSPDAPPEVVSGEWIGAGVLELSFSSPLQQGAAPDPDRFVIMSWSADASTYYNYGAPDSCQQRTNYRAFGAQTGYYYYYYSAMLPVADAWLAPEDPKLLRIRVANPGAVCPSPTTQVEAGLMLVYTNAEDPTRERLIDQDGDPVPAQGPGWAVSSWSSCALAQYSGSCTYSVSDSNIGFLPLVDELPSIPCP